MLHSLFLQVEPTSLSWKLCSPSSVTILTCLIPHQKTAQPTSDGGPQLFANLPIAGSSQAHVSSPTLMPSLMLAQAWELQFGSTGGGMHGISFQAGKPPIVTSDGLKQSDLSSSSLASFKPHNPTQSLVLRFMEITKELWKDGGRDAAVIMQPTLSSSAFTTPLNPLPVSSSHAMSLALSTLKTAHCMEDTLHAPFFCPPFLSLPPSGTSSSTLTPLYMRTSAKPPVNLPASQFLHPPKSVPHTGMLNMLLRTESLNSREKNSTK